MLTSDGCGFVIRALDEASAHKQELLLYTLKRYRKALRRLVHRPSRADRLARR